MLSEKIEKDVAIAKKICEGLCSGNKNCLEELVITYNGLFRNFARRCLFKSANFDDVTQSFWEEMLNGRTICTYAHNPNNAATLETYLVTALRRRIIDENRRISKAQERHKQGEYLEDTADHTPGPHNGLAALTSEGLARQLVHQALLKLSEEYPQDASLIRMHLEGLNYSQMAERIGKQVNAIKKQFTRESTGSLAKFKTALNRLMQAQNLSYEDI